MHLSLLLACATTAMALCPMSELTKRGLAPADLQAKYERGEGLGTPNHKRHPDPLEDTLASVTSRSLEDHIRSRFEERDADVDIDAPILTPKAHRRHVEKRGKVGGFLGPLTGPLAGLDVPTPQKSGLKAIPGNSYKHRYIAPGPTDVRGDCPTLNTLANHGYLSRDGVTSFAEATNAIQTAYSMGFGLAAFLSALGLLAGGDIPTGIYTIGGRDKRVPETLGVPAYGIDRHGLFELDGSISRGDRYFGDNHSFNITRWNQLVTEANKHGDGLFNEQVMTINAASRVDESRATNPDFTLGGNFAVVYATRALLYLPLPNGTDPEVQDFKNIAPFYLNETFPDDWFRVPEPISLATIAMNIGEMFLAHPQELGTTYKGKFYPLNVTLPDEPAALGCLGLALAASGVPDEAEPAVQAAAALFNQIFAPALSDAGCDVGDYEKNGGQPYYKYSKEDINGGSGSGITHFGEWDSKSKKPTGKSAGEPTRRMKRSFRV